MLVSLLQTRAMMLGRSTKFSDAASGHTHRAAEKLLCVAFGGDKQLNDN